MNETSFHESRPDILIVDDIPANLELLAGILKGRGFGVRAAVSGKLALAAARNKPPDLVLLDINMPEMDGYRVCEELKADEKLKDIPVIFISALNETTDKVKAFSLGGVDYITKPFQAEEVLARVETHLALRRQKRLLQESYDKLRALEKLRDGLVHMLVHDLRSPLAVIGSYMDFIRKDKKSVLSPDSLGDIAATKEAAEKMARMVSDVLDASKLEEGKMKLRPEEFDLGRLLEECAAELRPLLRGRRLEIGEGGRVMVMADRELIYRVAQNLLSNALKFAPAEGGLIKLEARAAGGRARVNVEDNGPGIAPEYRDKIFEKFGQAELRAGRQRNSTGLGLTFCKMAVEAHGGSIGVDSEEGKGSTFWFELPAKGPPGN